MSLKRINDGKDQSFQFLEPEVFNNRGSETDEVACISKLPGKQTHLDCYFARKKR